MAIQDLGISNERLILFQDGQQVVDFFDTLLASLPQSSLEAGGAPLQPVALVLLDISMPILSGLETLKQIKKNYGKYDEARLKRPLICYLSQLSYSPMINFIAEDE